MGGALDTFHYGSSGELRDRQLRMRLDLYGHVMRGAWTLAFDAPVVHNRILDAPSTPPLPCSSDYCANVTSIGEATLQVRHATNDWLTPMLAVRSDVWNAGTRGRWANAGQGSTSLVATLGLSLRPGAWQISARPYYALVIGTPVETGAGVEWLPPDHTGGSVGVARSLGWTWSELKVRGFTRLGGVDFGPEWTEIYPSEWVWSGLRYGELRLEARTGVEVRGVWVSTSVNRVVVQRNGPKDSWQFTLGVSRRLGED